jgi:hypothetical protein
MSAEERQRLSDEWRTNEERIAGLPVNHAELARLEGRQDQIEYRTGLAYLEEQRAERMATSTTTEFTRRMEALCEEAPKRVPRYRPHRFRRMVKRSNGDFAPKAKELLRGDINKGLVRLAKGGAIDISMEAVILEPRWTEFDEEDRRLARWRIGEAQRMAEAGEEPPGDW